MNPIASFLPHGFCYSWKVDLVFLHVISDALIALAYYSIPITILIFINKKKKLHFRWIYYLFILFIFLCGSTHLLSIIMIWKPLYYLQGILKVVTALVSIGTAMVAWPLIPKAITVPTPADLEDTNNRLREEIERRRIVEYQLLEAKQNLENRVKERTQELEDINNRLKEEIREHEVTQTKLVQAMEIAERASKLKSIFLAGVSHELRTPLNSILGFSQLLEVSEELSTRNRKMVQKIQNSGHHLLTLINDILDLSSIEARKLTIQLQPTDVFHLVRETLNFVQPMLKEKNIELIFHEASLKRTKLLLDPVRMKQILLNLLSNAIKYNVIDGKIYVFGDKNGRDFVLWVKDTGIGINKEDMDYIFDSFYRGSDHEIVQGTGIGLALVKQLCQLMNGTCGVDSQKGRGSTFWIRFPLNEG